ncbi:MAG TPA: hypothetical protein VIQ54_08265 [Polyangia bacterium]
MKPNPNILQIPLPGGSGEAPTGAVQFQNDWPGLFVRGDHAIRMRTALHRLRERLAAHPDRDVQNALYDLEEFADIIGREVLVPQDPDPTRGRRGP